MFETDFLPYQSVIGAEIKFKKGQVIDMKKLTKKQHRGAIKKLISQNENVDQLRDIQQVAEIFQEENERCELGRETLVTADAVRLLLDLLSIHESGFPENVYNALYSVLDSGERDIIDDIVDILEELDERKQRLVYTFVRAYAGK